MPETWQTPQQGAKNPPVSPYSEACLGPWQQAPRDDLGMASGAPEQSSRMAEETPSFLDEFLRDFPAPLSAESPVPWKIPGTVLSQEEVEGELAELAVGFLSSR